MDEEIERAIDALEEAVSASVRAEIDAACCQTKADWARAREARGAREAARAALDELITKKGAHK